MICGRDNGVATQMVLFGEINQPMAWDTRGYPIWIGLPGPKYSNMMRPPNYKLVVETDCRFFSPLKTQAIRQVMWATFFHPNSIAIPTFVFHVSVFCIVYRLSHL